MSELRIIPVVFGGKHFIITDHRMQYDYGQVLDFKDLELPDSFEARFSNSPVGESVGQIGTNNRIRIPKQFFESGEPIYCYITLHDEVTDGRTIYTTKVPIKPSTERTEEEPEPEEESIITQAITALNSAVDTTTQKAQEASASADRAEHAAEGVEGYAERAEAAQSASESARDRATQAETSARTSASTATEKASEAISSATTASQSALTAESASESAQASEQMALGYAEGAQDSARQARDYSAVAISNANRANQSASEASQKASEAAQSASTAVQAKTDAQSAKTASETAQGLAESARDGAVTAKTGAESARDEAQDIVDGITGKVEQIDSNTDRIESLEDDRYKPYPTDTASGSIASFPDGADNIPLKSCVVQVNPVQDLHGYDSPWPAGGGKNLADTRNLDVTVAGIHCVSDSDGVISLSGTRDSSTGWKVLTVFTDFAPGNYVFSSNNQHVTCLLNYTQKSSGFTVAEGDIVRIALYNTVAGDTLNDTGIKVQIESGSTATAWTPYENICPITGWKGCEVIRNGGDYTIFGVTTGKTLNASGEVINESGMGVSDWMPVNTGDTVTLKYVSTSAGRTRRVIGYDANKAFVSVLSSVSWANVGQEYTQTVTVENNVKYIRASFFVNDTDKSFINESTVSTYPITFPSEAGTVYGAYVDVGKGTLNAEWAQYILDGTTQKASDLIQIPMDSDFTKVRGLYRVKIADFENSAPYNDGEYICSHFKWFGYSSRRGAIPDSIFYNSSKREVCWVSSTFTTLEEFNQYLAEQYNNSTPVTLVYKNGLTTEFSVTPLELRTLLGDNSIWADTGDISVTYRADTTLYIKRLTESDTDTVADSNIVSGQYFMVGNNLYRATANIASGASVIEGTNATKVSLAQALNEINA